jgi:hypothetical protein
MVLLLLLLLPSFQVMKALCVRRLLLFPRFHASVKDSLEASPPEVRQLRLLS